MKVDTQIEVGTQMIEVDTQIEVGTQMIEVDTQIDVGTRENVAHRKNQECIKTTTNLQSHSWAFIAFLQRHIKNMTVGAPTVIYRYLVHL